MRAGGAVRTCAVLFVYGRIPRYENEALRTIIRLKDLNPTVRTILVTDNKKITLGHADKVNDVHLISTQRKKSWFPRLMFIKHMSRHYPDCDVTMALDSHVTICSGNLKDRLADFSVSEGLLGANVEHAPYRPYLSSPFDFVHSNLTLTNGTKWHRHLPHNFGIVFARDNKTDSLLQTWKVLLNGGTGDDQMPLMKAIEKTNFPFRRLGEEFAMGLKSVNKSKYRENHPRFTYLVPAGNPVTLIHSYDPLAVPPRFEGDICAFVNEEATRPRMLWQETAKDDYRLLYTLEDCLAALGAFEPRICGEFEWKEVSTKLDRKNESNSEALAKAKAELESYKHQVQEPLGNGGSNSEALAKAKAELESYKHQVQEPLGNGGSNSEALAKAKAELESYKRSLTKPEGSAFAIPSSGLERIYVFERTHAAGTFAALAVLSLFSARRCCRSLCKCSSRG